MLLAYNLQAKGLPVPAKNAIILVKTRLFGIKSDYAKNAIILVNTRLFGIKSDNFGKKCD
jgi:hypothetical protein